MKLVYCILWLLVLLGVAAGTYQIVQLLRVVVIRKWVRFLLIFVTVFFGWIGLLIWTIHLIRL